MTQPCTENRIIQQVSSWIHDERHCVSVGAVAQTFGVSKSQAAALLRDIPVDNKYIKTECRVRESEIATEQDENIKCTTFTLKSSAWKSKQEEQETLLYSLALEEDGDDGGGHAESLLTAHERDMARHRDLLADANISTLLHSTDIIAIAPLLEDAYMASIHSGRVAATETERSRNDPVSNMASSRPGGPKKVTTAKAFFQSMSTTTKTATKNKVPPPVKSTKGKENVAIAGVEKKQESTKMNHTPTSKEIGNVDDFVGDLEDSDEEEEIVVKATNKKVPPKRTVIMEDKDDEKEVEPVKEKPRKEIKGPMNAFSSSQPTKVKKRRKRLVDRTVQDKNGYLITEKQEIWEDVPTDEESPETLPTKVPPRPAATATKKKVTKAKPNTMKQGDLMGFFKKK